MAKWTTADIPSQKGKLAVVTGANSGIGWHTALELARADGEVILTARTRTKEWSPPHDGRDRLVVTLGKIGQLLPRENGPAIPARWTWIPANSDFKVPNEADETRNLMIVEFNDVDREQPSLIRLTE